MTKCVIFSQAVAARQAIRAEQGSLPQLPSTLDKAGWGAGDHRSESSPCCLSTDLGKEDPSHVHTAFCIVLLKETFRVAGGHEGEVGSR